jgi:hypothetical protein
MRFSDALPVLKMDPSYLVTVPKGVFISYNFEEKHTSNKKPSRIFNP